MDQKRKKEIFKEVMSYVATFAIALAVGLFINRFIVASIKVPTGSMESTIMPGDRLFGNRLAYVNSLPERGDIVVFAWPDNEEEMYIKRIIGLPGETVNIIDGKVYIDDATEPLDEPYLNETPYGTYGPYEVPEGHYFMLGDNRNHSADSRAWNNPYVALEKIQSRAICVYFPSPRMLK